MTNGIEEMTCSNGKQLTEMNLCRLPVGQEKQRVDMNRSDINTERLEPQDSTIIDI